MRRVITGLVGLLVLVGAVGWTHGATAVTGPVVNVDYAQLNFDYASSVNLYSQTVALSQRCTTTAATNCVGKNDGDEVLFKNVITAEGIVVDAAVTTKDIGLGTEIRYYEVRDNAQWKANPEYFWINNGFAANTASRSQFEIAFFQSGTHTATEYGTPVTLLNVQVSAIELDNSQYAAFTGADAFTLSTPTRLTPVPTGGDWMRFQAAAGNSQDNEAPEHRVVLTYKELQKFSVEFGKGRGSATNATYALMFEAASFEGYDTTTTLIDEPEDPKPEVVTPEEIGLEPGTEIVEIGTNDCQATLVNGNIAFVASPVCSGPEDLELVIREPGSSTEKDVNVNLQVGLEQKPMRPLGLPETIPSTGSTVIVDHKVVTNAGKVARVSATCQPYLRGDSTPCVLTRSHGVVTLATNGFHGDVMVKLRARADDEFGKYLKVKTYSTQR